MAIHLAWCLRHKKTVDAMVPLYCNGKTIPNKPYLIKHLGRFLPVLGAALKPYGKARPQDVFAWAGGRVPRQYQRSIRPLVWAAGRNPHKNGYHHDWHNITVMVFAAVLASLMPSQHRLSKDDQFTLLLAAMVHDLDHRGRAMAAKPYDEEVRSAMIAGRRLFGKTGHGQAWQQLLTMINQTSFHVLSVDASKDHLSALLKDADLLGSVVFPHHLSKAMTLGLKQEQKLALPSDKILSQFMENLSKRGLSSPEGYKVLTFANPKSSAFHQYPQYAKDLITNSISNLGSVEHRS